MRKNLVKSLIIGITAGITCIIIPTGSYNNNPVAIYQQPFNVAVFYLMYFIVQVNFYCEHSMFDIRCRTIFNAKVRCFSRAEHYSILYMMIYFMVSSIVSLVISSENFSLCFSSFSMISWFISTVFNLSILNIMFVNLNYLIKNNAIIITEIAIILGGLAMCFSASNLVPYVCIWFYGVYPKPVISPLITLFVYIIWAGIAILIGFIPIKEILRKE